MTERVTSLPSAGTIVMCCFPEIAHVPGPKMRPVVVLGEEDGQLVVAYGTSQHTDESYPGEFVVRPDDGEDWKASNLIKATKFAMGKVCCLPLEARFFPRVGSRSLVLGRIQGVVLKRMMKACIEVGLCS